jgi:hypothetical protein
MAPLVIESGTINLNGVQYFYQLVCDSDTLRKYVFRPGECKEVNPWTGEFIKDADSYFPSSVDPRDYPPRKTGTRTKKISDR